MSACDAKAYNADIIVAWWYPFSMEHQYLEPGQHSRHRHTGGYAALVLSGSYEEVGDTGRWQIEAGDLVYHQPYEAHKNVISLPCSIINIAIPCHLPLSSVLRVSDVDECLSAVAAGHSAMSAFLAMQEIKRPLLRDWPDLLARDLRRSRVRLTAWASKAGILPETVSRGFYRSYGVTPARYGFEARTRDAFGEIMSGESSLSEIAFEYGFSDQAHLTRSIAALTGKPPGVWRKVKSVQDCSLAAR